MSNLSRRSFIGGVASVMLVRPVLALPDNTPRVIASREASLLLLHPLQESLLLGDIITIEGVQAWSVRYPFTEHLREFVVTRTAEVGERLLYLYPYLIPMQPAKITPENERINCYATVAALPVHGARIERREHAAYWRVSRTGNNIVYTRME